MTTSDDTMVTVFRDLMEAHSKASKEMARWMCYSNNLAMLCDKHGLEDERIEIEKYFFPELYERNKVVARHTDGFKRIEVDFNVGQYEKGFMKLTTRGALRDLEAVDAREADFVLLTQDDDIAVGALLLKKDGVWVARFDWDDIFDLRSEK